MSKAVDKAKLKVQEAEKSKAKVSKAVVKKAKEVEVLGKDILAQITQEVNGLKEGQSIKLAKDLTQSIDCNYFKLGGTLAKINDEGWWEGEGFTSFQVYVQAELGMPYRKAMHLINIYDHLVESGIPYEKVKDLGWTKLKEIAPVINEDNVDKWVDTAQNMNNLQLMDEVKDYKKGDTSDAEVGEKVKSFTKSKVFKLHEDQLSVVEEAIASAKEQSGTEHDSVAMEFICLEFIGKPFKKKKPEKDEKEEKEEKDEKPTKKLKSVADMYDSDKEEEEEEEELKKNQEEEEEEFDDSDDWEEDEDGEEEDEDF